MLGRLACLAIALGGCGRVSYDALGNIDAGAGNPTSCGDIHAGAWFCDGYEDPSFAAWDYPFLRDGEASQTGSTVYRGAGALKAQTFAGTGFKSARYSVHALPDLRTGDVWSRAYYYVASTEVLDGRVSVLALAEKADPYEGSHLVLDADSVDLELESGTAIGTTAFPRDRWVCIEQRLLLSDVSGVAEAYVDGALVARADAIDTVPAGAIGLVEVGIHVADEAQGPLVLYVDEVVVAGTRIGCD